MSGGTISGNNAGTNGGGNGGGVCVYSGGTFTKTGGTIYGDTDTTHNPGDIENTARGNGHAVYVSSTPKYRNTTAGPGVTIDASTGTDGTDPWVH